MIILKEREWAEEMISSCSLGKKPSKTIVSVAKYYLDSCGNKAEAEKKIVEYIRKCDSSISIPSMQKTIDGALSIAKKYEMVDIDAICISENEMDTISKLKGVQIKRLAFALLCIAKYRNILNAANNCWVRAKDSEIMKMANINTSTKRQCDMFRCLEEEGLVSFSKKVDGTSMRINFVEDGECAFEVTDFRNLGYQYMMYLGEPYFKCSKCGITTKMNNPTKGSHQKYCATCAYKAALQQKVNYTMKRKDESEKNKN